MAPRRVRLGLRENLGQIALLVANTAFVGAMVGLERATLALIGEQEFGLGSSSAILSFVAAFGATKALANLAAGPLAERAGRRRLLVAGWILALPVPALVGLAPAWSWVVAANALLGASQGLAWSMTMVMKVDLAGPARRGLALGLNESAGYGGLAVAAAAGGWLASEVAPREVVAAGGAGVALVGLATAILFVRDTLGHMRGEAAVEASRAAAEGSGPGTIDERATRTRSVTRGCSQAGLVTNLGDALAWGIVPLFLAAHGASAAQIGVVAGVYPAVWGVGQVGAGHLSDRIGRVPLIVGGMLVQAAGLGLLSASGGGLGLAAGSAAIMGAGTALVYPTLPAAVADAASPARRASAVGRYRFWRDTGYVVGGLSVGVMADAVDYAGAILIVAAVTTASGVWAAFELNGSRRRAPTPSRPRVPM